MSEPQRGDYPAGDATPSELLPPPADLVWTEEQLAEFKAAFEEAMKQPPRYHYLRSTGPDVNAAAAAFAARHGAFSLHFDATQNYKRSDDCPWTLILDGHEDHGWGGFTACEALEFAAKELEAAGE